MSLRDSITSLATGTYTVTRHVAGSRTVGRYASGASSSFSMVASIQPATGRQLKDLPEGQRGDETLAVFTITEIKTRTPTTDPDIVTYGGESWTVIEAKRCESFGEVHFECLMVRAPSPAGAMP